MSPAHENFFANIFGLRSLYSRLVWRSAETFWADTTNSKNAILSVMNAHFLGFAYSCSFRNVWQTCLMTHMMLQHVTVNQNIMTQHPRVSKNYLAVRRFFGKTSANSFNIGIVAREICSWESSVTSLSTSATTVDPLAISLSISLGLISVNVFLR